MAAGELRLTLAGLDYLDRTRAPIEAEADWQARQEASRRQMNAASNSRQQADCLPKEG
jgi:hypothetical protein